MVNQVIGKASAIRKVPPSNITEAHITQKWRDIMSKVFVIDTNKKPLNPIHPGYARWLLKNQKAAVFRRYPFTIILKQEVEYPRLQSLRLKIDPGCKTTGLALVDDTLGEVVWAGALTHRGTQIRDTLISRRQLRRSRRNRKTRYRLDKQHWLDAACIGKSTPDNLNIDGVQPMQIAAKGHGTRQQCRTDKYGFPARHCSRTKFHKGFQTGDIVKAVVTKGKKVGTYVGRVATRATGSFNISTKNGLIQGISHKYCQHFHHKDGYTYQFTGVEVL